MNKKELYRNALSLAGVDIVLLDKYSMPMTKQSASVVERLNRARKYYGYASSDTHILAQSYIAQAYHALRMQGTPLHVSMKRYIERQENCSERAYDGTHGRKYGTTDTDISVVAREMIDGRYLPADVILEKDDVLSRWFKGLKDSTRKDALVKLERVLVKYKSYNDLTLFGDTAELKFIDNYIYSKKCECLSKALAKGDAYNLMLQYIG
jgi:hypothetical protein